MQSRRLILSDEYGVGTFLRWEEVFPFCAHGDGSQLVLGAIPRKHLKGAVGMARLLLLSNSLCRAGLFVFLSCNTTSLDTGFKEIRIDYCSLLAFLYPSCSDLFPRFFLGQIHLFTVVGRDEKSCGNETTLVDKYNCLALNSVQCHHLNHNS